ncbi:MAG: hypothetical protein LUD22_01930 [Coprobacillus sp.]|nr:hypothetical protein [Coprobacillus sp.]
MSSKNTSYNSSLKGVRLVDSKDAWIITKSGKKMLNPKYEFVGKMQIEMPNMIVSASDKKKPTYKEDVGNLNNTAKRQIINHFYDENGKRNKKRVAYFAKEKKSASNVSDIKKASY